MRRMNPIGWGRAIRCGALMMAALLLAVAPAVAVPANFDSTGVGFIPTPALLALPSATVDINVPLLFAIDSGDGISSDDVDFTGSMPTEICILAQSQPGVCQADLSDVTTGYSAIVTLEISAINTTEITGPFTLVVTELLLADASGMNVFAPGEVSIALDPTTGPMPTDTSGVPGFKFDGSFDSLVRIEDTACQNSGGNCNYLGWTLTGVGDTVTFRFDMAFAPNGRDVPILLFNAFPIVVPEPGTALLMGLGLAGLSFRRAAGPTTAV